MILCPTGRDARAADVPDEFLSRHVSKARPPKILPQSKHCRVANQLHDVTEQLHLDTAARHDAGTHHFRFRGERATAEEESGKDGSTANIPRDQPAQKSTHLPD